MSDPWERAKDREAEAAERRWRHKMERWAAKWRAQWPNHCTACGGHGGSAFHQSHPYGMGTASEQLFDPCECTMDGKCPRCGDPDGLTNEVRGHESTGEGPCKTCGWNYDDGLPQY